MPIEDMLDPSRVTFEQTLTQDEIDELRRNDRIRVLQTRGGADDSVWELLNDRFFRHRPEVQLRRFGIWGEPCDLSFLRTMPNVESFSVDEVRAVVDLEAFTRLPRLRALGIGIHELESLAFLERVPSSLEELVLLNSESKKLDLAILKRFERLRRLFVEEHRKNLDAIGSLETLEDVTLCSIRDPSLTFLTRLGNLRSLEFKLGGKWDLRSFTAHPAIRRLAVHWASGLSDLSPISTLSELQLLELSRLRRVEILPDLSGLRNLRRIYLDTMRGLRDLSSLGSAPSLEEFLFVASNHEPRDFLPLLRNPSLRRAKIGFGVLRKNRVFDALKSEHRIDDYVHTPFSFRDPID